MRIEVKCGDETVLYDQPSCLLKHINSLEPLLQGDCEKPITFLATDKSEKCAFDFLFKWLDRSNALNDMLDDMKAFRSLVVLADKYDVPALLRDLGVWYNSTMLTIINMRDCLFSTYWTVYVRCGCGQEHPIVTTDPDTADSDMVYESPITRESPTKYIQMRSISSCRCTNWRPPTCRIEMSGMHSLVDHMPKSDGDEDDYKAYYLDSASEDIRPIADYLFAAKYHMTDMMQALRVYTVILLKSQPYERKCFCKRLVEINGKLANEWMLYESEVY